MSEPAIRSCRGFTLVEVMVAAALGGLIMVGVLATNLQIVRSGIRITQYSDMEAQVRRGLERLGRDVRIASDITWNGPGSITLTIPSGGQLLPFTYAWSGTTQTFYVVPGRDAASTAGRVTLVRDIPAPAGGAPGVAFARFDRDGNAAANDGATKRIQVTMRLSRKSTGVAAASHNVVSATYTMRNRFTN